MSDKIEIKYIDPVDEMQKLLEYIRLNPDMPHLWMRKEVSIEELREMYPDVFWCEPCQCWHAADKHTK